MAKATTLEAQVAKAAKSALTMKGALADLLELRLAKASVRTRPAPTPAIPAAPSGEAKAAPKRMRRSGRVGFRRYIPTERAQILLGRVRSGTFRKYMIRTILDHTDTSSATAAHLASKEYEHETLNFKWAADNGYIEFI